MPTVDISCRERVYPVVIGPGLIGSAERWRSLVGDRRVLVITNDVVGPLYLERVLTALPAGNHDSLVLPDGEENKNQGYWWKVINELVSIEAGRDACLIALGGGVIGDIGGFAAASYMRGIDFIQVPTTLLAQVDASVGGKTGINHERGKNLVGAFHQPRAVLADTDTLSTLPEREYRAGLAEVVKYGVIRDPGFLDWLEERTAAVLSRDDGVMAELIERSVRNKAAFVVEDEREADIRALLNFGHSFAHALETLTGYRRYLHGEAVGIGMVVAATLSESRALCQPGAAARIASLLTTLGLPVAVPAEIPSAAIIDSLRLDKKVLGGRVRLVLLRSVGDALVDAGSGREQITAAIEACRA